MEKSETESMQVHPDTDGGLRSTLSPGVMCRLSSSISGQYIHPNSELLIPGLDEMLEKTSVLYKELYMCIHM